MKVKRVNHEQLKRVNDWWWAIGSFGGSVVKRGKGYFFEPNKRSLSLYPNLRTAESLIIRGPFYDLGDALKEAALVPQNHWLTDESVGDIPIQKSEG